MLLGKNMRTVKSIDEKSNDEVKGTDEVQEEFRSEEKRNN